MHWWIYIRWMNVNAVGSISPPLPPRTTSNRRRSWCENIYSKNVRLCSRFVLDVVLTSYVMRYSKPLLDEESNKSFFRDRHPVRWIACPRLGKKRHNAMVNSELYICLDKCRMNIYLIVSIKTRVVCSNYCCIPRFVHWREACSRTTMYTHVMNAALVRFLYIYIYIYKGCSRVHTYITPSDR